MSASILLAEDEELARRNIATFLQQEGFHVVEVPDGQAAIEQINQADFDVVVTDLKMPRADGLAVLKHVREISPSTFVIVTTAYASVESAVNAMRLGAQDYILKPVLFEDLIKKIRRLLDYKTLAWEIQLLRRETQRDVAASDLVGNSPVVRDILTLCKKVAGTESTVLITGESGVGKEVVARLIHAESRRNQNMFLPINCSAIPDTLLESQLFGYVKGAFTGASNSSEGLFQRARGGTIFLDEIGDLSETLQPKLLRVIEAKEVLPLGALQPAQIDVRLVAATHQDLRQAVETKQFREDLYYRLNVINIHIPPLRERREDIVPLVNFLIKRHNANLKKAYRGADSRAMRVLMSLPWKGNIRELDNVLERAMILGNGEWITRDDLPQGPEEPEGANCAELFGRPHDLKSALMAYEKMHIENVLKETQGNKGAAAQLLGLSRSSLYRKLDSLGFDFGRNGS